MTEVLVMLVVILSFVAVSYFLINPFEFRKQGADAERLTDIAGLRQAINAVLDEATSSAIVLCFNSSPTCHGSTQKINSETIKSNGNGWVKVDLTAQKSIPVPVLPLDPVNTGDYFYEYVSDGKGWEINVVLESERQRQKMTTDGGDNDYRYEVGTNLTLIN